MKGATAGIKVGITAIIIAIIGYSGFRFVAKGIAGDQGYEVYALFHDATGLVDKSRVQTAGILVGEIKQRNLQGNVAKVTLRITPGTVLWSNATISKKSASLLGEFYLDIDPGEQFTPDPLTGQNKENYQLQGCYKVTNKKDCNQIANVVEATAVGDVINQVNETLPVLRQILENVRKLTEGPVQQMLSQAQLELTRSAEAITKMLDHIDEILGDVRQFTHGDASDDLKSSMKNVREITEGVKNLVGSGEGQVNTTGDKLKRDLDNFDVTLQKLNKSLDKATAVATDISDVTGRLNRGEGTVGRLLKDDAIAENVGEITENASSFVRSLTQLQTIVGVREEFNFMAGSFKTYLSLKLQPRPDKYYLVEIVDDPRGSKSYTHTYSNTSQSPGSTPGMAGVGQTNTDTWTRTSAFRVSFMFAKRMEAGGVGVTARLGIKESTGGLGLDFDFFRQRFLLQIDLYDFIAEDLPRLKVMAALEVFKHAWLIAGVDDILNGASNDLAPGNSNAAITCGPTTPASWCRGGRDYVLGAQLSFNDDDLRALLTIGGSAIAGAAK